MKSFAHTGSTFEKVVTACSIYSSIPWRKLRINIAYSSVEIKISMTSFAHTGSTFEKIVEAWLMQNLVLCSLVQTAHEYCF